MSSNRAAKELEIKDEEVSTDRAHKKSHNHPISLRLPPALQNQLKAAAKSANMPFRDHLRAVLAASVKPKVSVEEVGAGHIEVLSARLGEVTRKPFAELRDTLLKELRALEAKREKLSPEEILKRVEETIKHVSQGREELIERTAKEIASHLRLLLKASERAWLRDVGRLTLYALSVTLLTSLFVACIVLDVSPWNLPGGVARVMNSYLPEHICFVLAEKSVDGTVSLLKPKPSQGGSPANQKGGQK